MIAKANLLMVTCRPTDGTFAYMEFHFVPETDYYYISNCLIIKKQEHIKLSLN
jgi:hypothetical protein